MFYRDSLSPHISGSVLADYELPLCGIEFISRKITANVARINLDKQCEYYLGNIEAKRDGGFIGIYTRNIRLIAYAERSQRVRQVGRQLKASDHGAYRPHRLANHSRETYVLAKGPRFKIKRVALPRAALSLRRFHHRSEPWGPDMGRLAQGGNNPIFISEEYKHHRDHSGIIGLEIKIGEYLGNKNIVRFDQYGGTK